MGRQFSVASEQHHPASWRATTTLATTGTFALVKSATHATKAPDFHAISRAQNIVQQTRTPLSTEHP